MRIASSLFTACFLLVGCSSSDPPHPPPDLNVTDAGADAAVDAAAEDAEPPPATGLAKLHGHLFGDFDNSAQHDAGFSKLVERHVCDLPGKTADPDVLWLYVEHVEDLTSGERDAYFTRVNEIRIVAGNPVSRAYKFAEGHPLATNAFSFNGPRDGCAQPDILAAITDADLVYRDGCDVTFVEDGDVYHATTLEGTCTFPGGYISTSAEVFKDGMDVADVAVSGGTKTGDTFEFRRLDSWVYP